MSLIAPAAELAETLVEPLGRRWLHVQAVARRASELAVALETGAERDLLVAAAWLHDIGYAPTIGHTRFHPLDGARYLREQTWPDSVVDLVAHHSGARFEAVERGLDHELEGFPLATGSVLDALDTADLTTGPSGEAVTYDERIVEILRRYDEDHPVHRTWVTAAPVMRRAIERTERRFAKSA